jgi:hypothetical protein
MAQPNKIVLAAVGGIFIILLAAGLMADPMPLPAEDGEYAALVREVGPGPSIRVDKVEFLDGEEARRAAAEDTECEAENAEECVPSLSSGFYVRNTEQAEIVVPVAPGALIRTQDGGSPVLYQRSFDGFEAQFRETAEYLRYSPFRIRVENGAAVLIEQQYLP